jgi:hypothetical protein
MTKHFYAIDHENKEQLLTAFTVKTARDNFVNNRFKSRRFSKTRKEADKICRTLFECDAGDAVFRGFI